MRPVLFFACFILLSLSASFQSPFENAIQHLNREKNSLNLSQNDVDETVLLRFFTDDHNGVTHVYMQQAHVGIKAHNAILNMAITADGKVVNVGNRYTPHLSENVNNTSPAISATDALTKAAAHLGNTTNTGEVIEELIGNEQSGVFAKGDLSRDDIPVKLVYQIVRKNDVRLCWEFVIRTIDGQHWWQIRMDAESGMFLEKNDWIADCSWNGHAQGKDHVNNENCRGEIIGRNPFLLTNSYNVFADPVESPNHGARTLEIAPWTNALNASPFGWHDTDGAAGAEYTFTRGNNVYATADENDDDIPGYAPDGGASLDFDFPLNLNSPPQESQDAAITNLFYFNNLMHDVWYQYGFNEASGNFQENNYGNGGLGDDYVNADAQDGGGINNANMGTPPDGQSPRMQMYFWDIGVGGGNTTLDIATPLGIAGSYTAVDATFGLGGNILLNDIVLVDDGSEAPTEGCEALVNGADLDGKIALVDRGNCDFVLKVINAQNAGAVGCIVCQNSADAPFAMGGNDPAITIPSVMIGQADCDLIKAQLPGVTGSVNSNPAVLTDGDYDNGIIAHEYTHGISTRLTGGADISGCLNGEEQMGEGWSDWFGLMMTIEPGDVGADGRGIGTFAIGQGVNGGGIRPFQYSTDMAVNPHTYDAIQFEAVPHGVGSVWCAMLWDLTWAFIDLYGFDPDITNGNGGNNMVMQLVVDGLKLQPCSPGFADGRDAILLADELNFGGIHHCMIWELFANRGLGYSADQGSSSSRSDNSEAYDMPPSCTVSITKTAVNEIEGGNVMTYSITVTNNTDLLVTGVTVTDEIPAEVIYVDGSVSCSATFNAPTLTIDIGDLPAFSEVVCTYQVDVPASPFSIIDFEDDMESGTDGWATSSDGNGFDWSQSVLRSYSPNTSWFASDPNAISDQYLDFTIPIAIEANTVLAFWHYYNTEYEWDGGVVEASTDGVDWVDLGSLMTQNGYNALITSNPASAISEREAFTGSSGGFIQTSIDMSSYEGMTPVIRFRMASDEFVSSEGWFLDDVILHQGIVDFENIACVSSNEHATFCGSVYTLVLEPTCPATFWFEDSDGDSFGGPTVIVSGCTAPPGYVADNTDCDDSNEDVYPGALGTHDDIDNDCNGIVEGDELSCLGDFNGDQLINVADLLFFLSDFGCQSSCVADMNGDDAVNASDLIAFLAIFGTACL